MLLRCPWILPVAMTGWNILYVVIGLMTEYRVKATAARFAVLYAATVPAAVRGDLEPFWMVFTRPPE